MCTPTHHRAVTHLGPPPTNAFICFVKCPRSAVSVETLRSPLTVLMSDNQAVFWWYNPFCSMTGLDAYGHPCKAGAQA